MAATKLTKVDDAASADVEDAGHANPDNGFRYDETLAGYVYNVSTKGLSSGTWKLTFAVTGDDLTHSVTFGVR